METFGQTVKKLRKAKKLTQLELAERIGVDFTYISKIENDRYHEISGRIYFNQVSRSFGNKFRGTYFVS